MKLLLIDPTGINYGAELARALPNYVDLTYVTSKNEIKKDDIKCVIKYWFYASQKKNRIIKVYKGIRYVIAYAKIIQLIKKNKIDVVHIQWLLLPSIDMWFLRKLKTLGVRLILTAHNVLPHRNSESFRKVYYDYYSFFDKVIIHGESIKTEFSSIFPEFVDKLEIEKHGAFNSLSTNIDENNIPGAILNKIKLAKKTGIFFGNMFFNKGVHELVSFWIKTFKNNRDFFLIVVGKLDPSYKEMLDLDKEIADCTNILYKNEIVEETELNAYISLSDIVLLPYKHASMSGVVFKAAAMNKTVLATNTGSIKEYLPNEYSFCEDTMDDFFARMYDVFMCESRQKLFTMGQQFAKYITQECSWNSVAKDTVEKVYYKSVVKK